eukprot:2555764-Lingulodinium_polyedra.AAC.1
MQCPVGTIPSAHSLSMQLCSRAPRHAGGAAVQRRGIKERRHCAAELGRSGAPSLSSSNAQRHEN